MRIFICACGNALHFENSVCLGCGHEVGWCPACRTISALIPETDTNHRCGNPQCGAQLRKCHNYHAEGVCNRCLTADTPATQESALCDCCVYNETIPDLSVDGNREKWARLEAAKRRLFYELDNLRLPHGTAAEGFDPPLSFDFKADVIPANEFWRTMDNAERVYTGHDSGKITINIREADDAEREKLRVDLDEGHRTLVGHFRHEIGHYYWDLLVKGRREQDSIALFGDHGNPTYAEALERHYAEGPPPDWSQRFISAYASMHPWEDFAESFAAYLAQCAVLDTASAVGVSSAPNLATADFDTRIERHREIGIAMNEMNRTMGLLDFLPELFVPPVIAKLRFIDDLVRQLPTVPQA